METKVRFVMKRGPRFCQTIQAIFLGCFFIGLNLSGLRAQELPLNDAVKEETLSQTICVRGYTRTVRPPANITNTIKYELLRKQGYPFSAMHDFILDHKIPLSLGGAPNDLRNFMLQTEAESRDKDRVELCLAKTVCSGRLSLAEAQREIWRNWRSAARLCSGFSVIDD